MKATDGRKSGNVEDRREGGLREDITSAYKAWFNYGKAKAKKALETDKDGNPIPNNPEKLEKLRMRKKTGLDFDED